MYFVKPILYLIAHSIIILFSIKHLLGVEAQNDATGTNDIFDGGYIEIDGGKVDTGTENENTNVGNGNINSNNNNGGSTNNELATQNGIKLNALSLQLTIANGNIASLQNQFYLLNNTYLVMLSNRVSSNFNTLTTQINNVQTSFTSQLASLKTQMGNDLTSAQTTLNSRITLLSNDVDKKLSSTRTVLETTISDLSTQLMKSISDMENGKVASLINDNILWRKNFRVINATFSRLKKSNNRKKNGVATPIVG